MPPADGETLVLPGFRGHLEWGAMSTRRYQLRRTRLLAGRSAIHWQHQDACVLLRRVQGLSPFRHR